MRLIALLSLVAIAFAGCASTPPVVDVPDVVTEPPVELPFVSHITLVSNERGGGEPSLGVTPDGVLFTNIFSRVYRSLDNGSTWQEMTTPTSQIPNNDPDLAVDLDGVVWESRLYALACNAVSVSRDQGETWFTHPAVCNGPVGDRQYVVPTKDCTAYLYWHQVPTFYQTVMKTTDCGLTWTPTGPAETPDGHLLVNDGSSWGGGGFYNTVSGSTFITYTRSPGLAGFVSPELVAKEAPGYSVTRDGLTWEEGVGPAFEGSRLGLGLVMGAADKAGNVYLTWGENIGGDVAVFVAGSQDDGRTWSDKVRIDDGIGSKVFPAIVALADGKVAVAYYEAETDGHPDVATNWTVSLGYTQDFFGTGLAGNWTTQNIANNTVVKADPICISGTTCSSGREFLDYFAMDAMPDGRVAVVYNTMPTPSSPLRNQFALIGQPILA